MQQDKENIPDVYEMPFNSLDYSISYINKNIEYKLGVQNMLNSKVVLEQILPNDVVQTNMSYRPGVLFNFSINIKIK